MILKASKEAEPCVGSLEQGDSAPLCTGLLLSRQDDSSCLSGLLTGVSPVITVDTTTRGVTITKQAKQSSVLKTEPKGKEKVCVFFVCFFV